MDKYVTVFKNKSFHKNYNLYNEKNFKLQDVKQEIINKRMYISRNNVFMKAKVKFTKF